MASPFLLGKGTDDFLIYYNLAGETESTEKDDLNPPTRETTEDTEKKTFLPRMNTNLHKGTAVFCLCQFVAK